MILEYRTLSKLLSFNPAEIICPGNTNLYAQGQKLELMDCSDIWVMWEDTNYCTGHRDIVSISIFSKKGLST